jgi:hypothetical protein
VGTAEGNTARIAIGFGAKVRYLVRQFRLYCLERSPQS